MVIDVYNKIMSKLIRTAPSFNVIKVYDFLITANKFEGGVVGTKQFIANKIQTTLNSVIRSFKWLKDNNYVTETTVNGIPKFIINENILDNDNKITPSDTSINIKETNKPKATVIHRGGKTITRYEIPD